jgi:phosphohistidine phosphatase SixA
MDDVSLAYPCLHATAMLVRFHVACSLVRRARSTSDLLNHEWRLCRKVELKSSTTDEVQSHELTRKISCTVRFDRCAALLVKMDKLPDPPAFDTFVAVAHWPAIRHPGRVLVSQPSTQRFARFSDSTVNLGGLRHKKLSTGTERDTCCKVHARDWL